MNEGVEIDRDRDRKTQNASETKIVRKTNSDS